MLYLLGAFEQVECNRINEALLLLDACTIDKGDTFERLAKFMIFLQYS